MHERMPALFVGHGSPINAIENNAYTAGWEKIAGEIPKPLAILSVSAHWVTDGTRINSAENPKTLYDMYGFPDELYRVVYDAPGAPELARATIELISREVKIDNSWGIDHGTWSVLYRMYPKADIPVYQLSIDSGAPAEIHYKIGKEISLLREKGVMIFGSGNVVHNLSRVNWGMEGGYPWASTFDDYIRDKLVKGQLKEVINYEAAGGGGGTGIPDTRTLLPSLVRAGSVKAG